MELRICLLLLPLLLLSTTTSAHNITHILAKHPEFSTFNHYLTITHLASEINRRRTITVCAVDNSAMGELVAKHYPIEILKNVLSLHIFADYFGAKKLHQITHGSTTTSSIFQATGEAAGTSGYVNITDMKGGKVGFIPVDTDGDHPMATYVKSLEEQPYNLAVIQISHVLSSPEAEAPVGSPNDINITSLMEKQGCLSFSKMITDQGQDETFTTSLQGGLTIFCPSDEALKTFMPKYRNLTSDAKTSLLLYHGLPVYYSLGMLRSSNGLMNTLATEGSRKKYDFNVKNDGDDVKLETKVVTALVKGTLIDDEPLAVFKIDKVLQPTELFKAVVAAAPKASRTRHAAGAAGGGGDDDDDADAPSEEDDAVADATASGGGRIRGAGFGLLVGILMWSF